MSRKLKRNIVSYWELEDNWQSEACSNLDELAEEAMYLEPLKSQRPSKHVLYDLTECMPVRDNDDYNAYIGISNNSAMLLKIDDTFESAVIWYV